MPSVETNEVDLRIDEDISLSVDWKVLVVAEVSGLWHKLQVSQKEGVAEAGDVVIFGYVQKVVQVIVTDFL